MPINPTLEYQKAERKYHEARTISEKIKALEEMLRTCPKHKGSEGLQQEIKTKLSKLRDLQEKQKTTGARAQIAVRKEGAAQVVILGVPNSGKSTLLSKLTNAKPVIADYPFTTTMPEIGVMEYEGVKIQIVEIPAITADYTLKNMGPTFLGIVRQAELAIILANDEKEFELIKDELAQSNIIIDRERPKIHISKSGSGGLMFVGKIKADEETAKKVLREHGVHNATVEFQEVATLEDLEEVLTEGISYVKTFSIKRDEDIENLKGKIWKNLGLIKVFTKQPGRKKDYPPVPMKKGSTIRDLALRVHKDFLKKFGFARVWGDSVKFEGAQQGLDHVLEDNDVVEFHTKQSL